MGGGKIVKVSILDLAKNDLKEIQEYLSNFGVNPTRKFRESFEKFCYQVKNMPNMFEAYVHNGDYRKAVLVFGYLVFYQVSEELGEIKIYRILHSKRDTGVFLYKED